MRKLSFLKIHCKRCRGTWEQYQTSNYNSLTANVCPHCLAELDRTAWDSVVIPAFGTVIDANTDLEKLHIPFSIEIRTNNR